MTKFAIKGADSAQFLNFLDDQQKAGLYPEVDYEEKEAGDGHLSDGGISAIILTGIVSVIASLITNYLSRHNNNEITFEIEREDGKKMTVSIKNMSVEEVKQSMREFLE
jgi:hypothetical protein